jgi:threonine 3-dehydrogenase
MMALLKSAREPGMDSWPWSRHSLAKIKYSSKALERNRDTDMHIEEWDNWASNTISPPLIPGREFVDEMGQTGTGTHPVRLDDLVSGEGQIVCGDYRNCMAGNRHLCTPRNRVGYAHQRRLPRVFVLPDGGQKRTVTVMISNTRQGGRIAC